jgi:hypothetical protein
MTVAFAAGQLAGPVVVRVLGPRSPAGLDAVDWTHAVVTVLLVVTAAWLWQGTAKRQHS